LVVQIENLKGCRIVGEKNLLKRRIFKGLRVFFQPSKSWILEKGEGGPKAPYPFFITSPNRFLFS